MLQSSAYRTKQCLRRSNSRSSSSSTRFDNSGDKGPPCGVPSSTGPTSPFSITPAVRNARINLSALLSATRRATAAISLSWLTRSKNFFQIQINHPVAAFSDVLLRLGYRLMRRASGPEPVAVFGKLRVPPALQDLQHRLLHHAVQHRRDAQLSHPSVRLGYLYPIHRLRLISPCKKLFADDWPVFLQVSR